MTEAISEQLMWRYAMSACVGLALLPAGAHARETGFAGVSGRTGGLTCGTCHVSEGTEPSVILEGPTELAAETSAVFALTLYGGPAEVSDTGVGGLDVAASAGTLELDPAETGMQVMSREIVHSEPRVMVGGVVSWTFVWRAPLVTTGTETLFGAALSANGNGQPDGDHHALATLNVTVTGGVLPEPDAGQMVGPEPMLLDGGPLEANVPDANPGMDAGFHGSSPGGCSVAGRHPSTPGAWLVSLVCLVWFWFRPRRQ